jgi:D-arabinose 5-phosphate isomerase GutQ
MEREIWHHPVMPFLLLLQPDIDSAKEVSTCHWEIVVLCGQIRSGVITKCIAIRFVFLIEYIVYLQNNVHVL